MNIWGQEFLSLASYLEEELFKDLFIDEIAALLDIARENGYEGDYEQFKYDLYNRPEVIPFPKSSGPDFKEGGLVSLGYLLWGAISQRTEEQKHSRADWTN